MLLIVQLLLLLTLSGRTDGYYFFMTDECITSSPSLYDAEYIETFYFNRNAFIQFNSTVGRYVGFDELGVENAERWNSGNQVVVARSQLEKVCKHNLRIYYSGILEKSVKPTVKLTSEEQSSGDQPVKLICSAYNFYPPAIEVSWLIDGKKVTTDVVSSEEMANGDWYYQIHSHLVYTPSKSGEKISCVVEHASSNKPIIKDWSESLSESDTIKIGVGVSVLVVGIILSVAGSICYCRKKS